MKEKTKTCFKKLSELTGQKCAQCPAMADRDGEPMSDQERKFRCCDKMFCDKVEGYLASMGVFFGKPNVGGIPYMGEKGCVVPPHLRPFCSGFVCHPHFKDRDFRREYDRLINKIASDPNAPDMPNIMSKLVANRKIKC